MADGLFEAAESGSVNLVVIVHAEGATRTPGGRTTRDCPGIRFAIPAVPLPCELLTFKQISKKPRVLDVIQNVSKLLSYGMKRCLSFHIGTAWVQERRKMSLQHGSE